MTLNIWVTYIFGGAIALLLGSLAILLVINADQRAVIATDDAAKSLLQSQNREWAQKITQSNAALQKIKAEDAAKATAIAKAQTAAVIAQRKLETEASFIGSFSFIGSDCDEVMAVKQAYMEHLK